MKYFFLLLPASVIATCEPGFTGRNCQIAETQCFTGTEILVVSKKASVNGNTLPVCDGTNFPCFYKPGTQLSYECLPNFGSCPYNTDFDDTKSCAQGCTSENFVTDCCEVRKPCFYGDYVFRGDPYCVCHSKWAGPSCNAACIEACPLPNHGPDLAACCKPPTD